MANVRVTSPAWVSTITIALRENTPSSRGTTVAWWRYTDPGWTRSYRDGTVEVAITPTYSGCPAMATMRDDLVHRLRQEGYDDVRVRIALDPAWTTDWITAEGRAALAAAGISPPGPAPRHDGPVALQLGPTRRDVRCPRCASADVELSSEFGSTACKAMYRCRACLEPFDHVKEI